MLDIRGIISTKSVKNEHLPNTKTTIFFLVTEDWYFNLHRIPLAEAARQAGYRVVIAARDNGNLYELENRGFEVERLAWSRGHVNPFRLLMELIEVCRAYNRIQPNLIHHIAIKPSLIGGIAALGMPKAAVINNFAGLGVVFASSGILAYLAQTLLKQIFRIILTRKNSTIIVENQDDSCFFLQQVGIAADIVKLIRGVGVDTDRFIPTPEPDGKLVVTMVSRMLWYKGVKTLIEAAQLLRSRGLDIIVRLVGDTDDGSVAAVPREQLKAWHKEGAIEWLGYQNDIPAVWRNSHIAALPSYYREGIPRSLLEAAASGRPIITTNMPGCREIVIDGVNGILVKPKDCVQLADAIARMANDQIERKRMGKAGRCLVEEQFSERLVVEQFVNLYRALTTKPHALPMLPRNS